MGWLTGAVCTIVAALCLYRFLVPTKQSESSVTRQQTVHTVAKSVQKQRLPSGETQPKVSVLQPESPVMLSTAETVPVIRTDRDASRPERTTESSSVVRPTMSPPALPQVTPPASSSMPPPQSSSPPRLKPPTFGAPPRPGGASLRPPPSLASSLRVPPQKVLSNTSMAPSSLMAPPKKQSRQVALEPGHSPLDWANLTTDPNHNLRGKDAPDQFIKITPSQLKTQNGRKGRDAWTVYQGKVYNITPYVPFHPGGKGELLRGAGKDSAKLFMEVHPWVNWDGMLKECMVGILVSEAEKEAENTLDEMD